MLLEWVIVTIYLFIAPLRGGFGGFYLLLFEVHVGLHDNIKCNEWNVGGPSINRSAEGVLLQYDW